MKFTVGHGVALAAILGGLGTMIAGLPDWHTALTPSFVGGALALLGGIGKALDSDSVTNQRGDIWTEAQRRAFRDQELQDILGPPPSNRTGAGV